LQGTNTAGVQGDVKRWNYQTGLSTVEARRYIEMLEKEVEILRERLSDSSDSVRRCSAPL
jgi:hypothetical protein